MISQVDYVSDAEENIENDYVGILVNQRQGF